MTGPGAERLGHVVVRTSPHGTPFVGTCLACRREIVGVRAAAGECPADTPTRERALVAAVQGRRDA